MRMNEVRVNSGGGDSDVPCERKIRKKIKKSVHKNERYDVKGIIKYINSSKNIDSEFLEKCMVMFDGYGESVYVDVIYNVSRLNITMEKAKTHWNGIIEHMQGLNDKLGRNVGIHVAAGDYFANIKNYFKHPVLIEEQSLVRKEDSAYKDGLTGLFNRRFFDREIPSGVAKFKRFGIPCSLLMLDLDHFKNFNDQYGHQAGDLALQAVADVIGQRIRIYDRAMRYGGDEFAIILHRATRSDAAIVAEKVRVAISKHSIVYRGQNLGGSTVSIGVATCPVDALDVEGLIRRADQALYLAKRQRNAVVAFCDYSRTTPRYVQERRLRA